MSYIKGMNHKMSLNVRFPSWVHAVFFAAFIPFGNRLSKTLEEVIE